MDAVDWIRILTFLPLLICSLVGFALTLAKWRSTRQSTPSDDQQRQVFLARVEDGDVAGAVAFATEEAPLSVRLAARALENASGGRDRMKERADRLGQDAIRRLESGLGGLALIATLGPLFGLLGTVVGIILIFGQLTATGGLASPQQLAGGIGTALYTTVGGLLIGVFALVSHYLVAARVDRLVAELETTVAETIELIYGDDA